ncbi:hypothetical protein Acsp07_12800 [Actinomycetospora sp. NBRC 106378]|nr:hypothetical protein Acsp07_12800 [Actinomycetospora sp. NBRC 106378]
MSDRTAGARRFVLLSCVAATFAGAVLGLLAVRPALMPYVSLLLLVLLGCAGITGYLGIVSLHGTGTGAGRGNRPRSPQEQHRLPGPPAPSDARGPKARAGGLFEGHPQDVRTPGDDQPARPGSQTLRQVLPAGDDWWNQKRAPRSSGALSAPTRRPAPPPAPADPREYLADALIAQCPACGSLFVDVAPVETGYEVRCRSCATPMWLWRPDRPWPGVTLRPGAEHAPAPARAISPEGL